MKLRTLRGNHLIVDLRTASPAEAVLLSLVWWVFWQSGYSYKRQRGRFWPFPFFLPHQSNSHSFALRLANRFGHQQQDIMRLIPAFSALLLALQLVGAIHSDQVHHARFVQVKRAVSGTDGENQPQLNRRGGVQELIEKYEGMAGHESIVAELKKLLPKEEAGTSAVTARINGETHVFHPHPGSEAGTHTPPTHHLTAQEMSEANNPTLARHGQLLENHKGRFDDHIEILSEQARAIEAYQERMAKQEEALLELEKLTDAQGKKLSTASKKRLLKTSTKVILASTGAFGIGALALGSHANTQALAAQNDQLAKQAQEIKKLQGGGSQSAPTVSGPDVASQGGVPAAAPGVGGAGSSGGLV